jgi:sugar lactone lactonase YvrE
MADSKPPPLPTAITPEPVAHDMAFAEGPAFDADGLLYFVNYQRLGTLGRVRPGETPEVWVETGGQVNGLKCDAQGRLAAADIGAKRITRFDTATGAMEVLTDNFEGEPYLGPNDVCLDRGGNVYFTDPAGSSLAEPFGSVYRIDIAPDGTVGSVQHLDGGLAYPNGLAIHPDGQRFYLAETGTDCLLAYDLEANGTLSNRRTVVQFPSASLDGMAFDAYGRLWVARWLNGTVDVVDVDAGLVLASYGVGERATNLCWWGDSLYVTVAGNTAAGNGSIVRLAVGVAGHDPMR